MLTRFSLFVLTTLPGRVVLGVAIIAGMHGYNAYFG